MSEAGPGPEEPAVAARLPARDRTRWKPADVARGTAKAILNLTVTKPLAIFVWWISNWANTTDFEGRDELRERIERAAHEGRPVLFASNHLSMFDDPVLPMVLYRTGRRSAVELTVLAFLIALCLTVPAARVPPSLVQMAALAWATGIAFLGARKVWWSLGDLVNFSGVTALRGKLEFGRTRPLSRFWLALLAIADPAIFFFMRSAAVKTVLVDRRAGEEARKARARSVALTVDIAARGEPIWIFFEGGRAKVPGEIGPARRGIGDVIIGLRNEGLDPLVVAVRHRGMERVIPRDSDRWVTAGNRIEVKWAECFLDPWLDATEGPPDPLEIAEAVREKVLRIRFTGGGSGKGDA